MNSSASRSTTCDSGTPPASTMDTSGAPTATGAGEGAGVGANVTERYQSPGLRPAAKGP